MAYTTIPPGSSGDPWFSRVKITMRAGAPALTAFDSMKLGEDPSSVAFATAKVNDGVLPGGVIGNPATNVNNPVGVSTFQALKTSSWAMAWLAKLPTSTAGAFKMLGFVDGATGTHDYGIATYSTADATKVVIYTFNGAEKFTASTFTADTAWHDFVMTFNGTTITLFVDGISRATQTDLTKITDETVYPVIQGPNALDVLASRFAYGYIAPV